jgi:hypothetical protein
MAPSRGGTRRATRLVREIRCGEATQRSAHREQAQLLLEQVLRLSSYVHPVIRHSLASEAKRLWFRLELGPCPSVEERRPLALALRERATADAAESARAR